jgi:hypothetical protein
MAMGEVDVSRELGVILHVAVGISIKIEDTN